MNLGETIRALESKGVQLAIDLGVHQGCSLESNCPKAVELRNKLSEANIGLDVVLEGYQQVTAPELHNPQDFDGFSIDGNISLTIAGQSIDLDLTETIRNQINDQLRWKIENINRERGRLASLGRSLRDRYLNEIRHLRRTEALPQLGFEDSELLRYGIMMSKYANDYIFLAPFYYHPEYIVDVGVRYELAQADKTTILQAGMGTYLKFVVSKDNVFINLKLLNRGGGGFVHYHGRENWDCWGAIQNPGRWDKRLSTLDHINRNLSSALVTINYNSLLTRAPPGMPNAQEMLLRATRLGSEGEIASTETTAEQPSQPTRRGWGRQAR